jgi:protoheme IX farnesyltransferase
MPADVNPPTDIPTPSVGRILGATRVLKSYVALTKPRIIELLLITTLPTMVLAAKGWPGLSLMAATLIGGTLSAGSANVFNSYLDRDIDAVMRRTQGRPLVTGAVKPRAAIVFAWVLAAISTAWFWWLVKSPLATVLSVIAILIYTVGYTMLLKRRTSQNIVWGGAAGCMPVLIGWAAVTHSLSLTPFVLFLIIFFWTPPHYWPLALKFRKDYEHAEVPMLPVVATPVKVAKEMIAYAVAMAVVSLLLVPLAGMTWIYAVLALGFGVWFIGGCYALYRRTLDGSKLRSMRLFRDSIMYLSVVFGAILADPFWPNTLTVWQR